MATASFDEKVVVTDPETIKWMKADLDDPTPVVHSINPDYDFNKIQENGRKWASKLLHSKR